MKTIDWIKDKVAWLKTFNNPPEVVISGNPLYPTEGALFSVSGRIKVDISKGIAKETHPIRVGNVAFKTISAAIAACEAGDVVMVGSSDDSGIIIEKDGIELMGCCSVTGTVSKKANEIIKKKDKC
jgi:hypothetical protein